MAVKEDQYVDNPKRLLPIKNKAAIITSEFSSPKQLTKNCASSIAKISSQNYVKQVASHFSTIFCPLTAHEQLSAPVDDAREKDSTSKLVDQEIEGTTSNASSHDNHCDSIIIDIVDDATNGLSMLAQEVQSDGTAINVKGQWSNIFQSECKIQDKVCKLIIDGGSFTNAISSDVVHALSLSTLRLLMSRYIQWMNQWYTQNYSQGAS
jgi:hypothetical protein